MIRAAHLLAVLALFSLASMPFGYMPDRADGGAFVLRICGGTMVVDAKATDHVLMQAMHSAGYAERDSSDTSDHETRCNYAVAGAAYIPQAPVVAVATHMPPIDSPAIRRPITGIFPAKLPPSTGPPPV